MAQSEESGEEHRVELTRRTLMQAMGVAAGGGLLGTAGSSVASAATGDTHDAFRNWRAIEAQKVWDRGYRGRSDRTIALTDSGLDARHPDIGPWNGVKAFTEGDELKLTKPANNDVSRVKSGETEQYTGTMSSGTFATGEEKHVEFVTPSDVDELDSTLSWSPVDQNDLEFRLDVWTGSRWETEARAATGSQPEKLLQIPVESETKYRYVIEAYLNTTTDYEISGTYYDIEGTVTTYDDSVVFEDTSGTPTADTPKAVGWYDAESRYGLYDRPRDPNGHGSHCSSIMGGTGRASAIDGSAFTTEQPETALSKVTNATLTYGVDVEAGTGLVGAAYGELVELRLYDPDGNQIDSSGVGVDDSSTWDVNTVEQPATVSGTYTFEIAPADGEDASAAYVERVGYGPFLDPDATAADRLDGPTDGVHTGFAPDQSLLCLQGLSGPAEDLGRFAGQFADTFNMRAVNMSWGYVGGLPLGAAAGTFDRIPAVIKDIAQEGILTLAAAGNAATPVNGNGSPAIADEAVSVVATGPLDGISGYSSGGIGGIDEDEEEAYMKPDVSAPGGTLTDVITAGKNGQADVSESEQPPIRDYTGKAGTSMATPFTTGATGLVAQAMEEDGGPRLGLPAPADTTLDDVFRLKQLLLATASETVFTAAPYHRAKTPTYDFGGRDPYEGFGRLNPDAAVDAATRELSGTTSEQLGLDLPTDSRAVAGYVDLGVGELEASVEFTGYEGSDADVTDGVPHVDLFVYDGGAPAEHGEPNIVDRAAGVAGSASVSAAEQRGGGGSTYLVVAKLVDVPGGANGDDVQANVDLTVDKRAGVRARGNRTEDDGVLGAGITSTVEVTVEPDADVAVRDVIPEEWTVLSDDILLGTDEEAGVTYVDLGDAPAGEQTTFTYEVESPTDLLDLSKAHLFGPVQVDDGSGWSGVSGTTGTKTVDGD
ncbi:S8 family serine peptidase [Halobacterium zhouii]|uniref:S8 family serine peptidase n=1 Tax=Halobacterium zhouii TaxID=2902624 RepID=UPI001E2C93DB|nr:S8 family serine peptidase [Halobacterium zhouii]